MKIKIKKLNSEFKNPFKKHNTDACFDLVATSKEDLGDGRIVYGLGFSAELPEGTRLDLRSRSSIHKTGLILSNCIGTGDQGYTGEYKAVFYHVLKNLKPYNVGDRIIQIHLEKVNKIEFEFVENLIKTSRGDGGYGSTGN
jgi:dUTP pyrophosphatase